MEVKIDITQNIKDQFDRYFNLTKTKTGFRPNPAIIDGEMEYVEFPGELEFYYFHQSQFRVPVNMKSVNPPDTNWFLIHINLSNVKQEKKVGDETIEFLRYSPIGILLYGPDLEIITPIPPNVDSELASIHFSYTFLKSYFEDWESIIDRDKSLVYEDLDPVLESKLSVALSAMNNKIKCHGLLLDFMQHFFDKLRSHQKGVNPGKLHPEDLRRIFQISTKLRNPTTPQIPTLTELANTANMGKSKFKASFKQVFGLPPIEYHNRVRMEYARTEIQNKGKSPTEVSYILGYSHPSNFTKAYKKYFGVLPSESN